MKLAWKLTSSDITEVVIVLNSDEAVRAFSLGGNVTVGGSSRRLIPYLPSSLLPTSILRLPIASANSNAGGISASAGPIGTGGQVSSALANPSPMFSYFRSKGPSAHLLFEPSLGPGDGGRGR